MAVPQFLPRQARRFAVNHETAPDLGVNLLGARNSAIQSLVAEVPAPLVVAELLGYSYQIAQRHAEIAAQPWSRYVT